MSAGRPTGTSVGCSEQVELVPLARPRPPAKRRTTHETVQGLLLCGEGRFLNLAEVIQGVECHQHEAQLEATQGRTQPCAR